MDCRVAFPVLLLALHIAFWPDQTAAEDVPTEEIRDARSRFNLAIGNNDAERIAEFLAPGYILITGRGDRFDGQDANVELWRSTFRNDPTFNCQRMAEDVVVNADWGLAQETGRWMCSQTVEGMPGRYTGVYAARWQLAADSAWLLQSEVFTTLTCEGPEAACRRPDPLAR